MKTKQIKIQIQETEKGIVVFWATEYRKTKKEEIEDEEVEVTHVTKLSHPILKAYYVFHIDDTTLESKFEPVTHTDAKPIEQAEQVVTDYLQREPKLTFENNAFSNDAYYSPSRDLVHVPMLSQYDDAEEYYSTTFHELVHSTAPEYRCNRRGEKDAHFGNDDYSREELVAEIGSAMLCTHVGIDCEKAFNNSVAYVRKPPYLCAKTAYLCAKTAYLCAKTAYLCAKTAYLCAKVKHGKPDKQRAQDTSENSFKYYKILKYL